MTFDCLLYPIFVQTVEVRSPVERGKIVYNELLDKGDELFEMKIENNGCVGYNEQIVGIIRLFVVTDFPDPELYKYSM
ncbi:hypothetical protein GE061_008795 [Apolygus lucorum]|uniref:Uncharacterized protein n=1 Tax=Apolygus lucorum TaxID=248454 RepID=A0A8S9WM01_APOLU|nr:hypothetical protein GE061_008795 [Apolygus lucorum]